VFEVVYGGARGGGKTDAVLGEWANHAKRYGEDAKGLIIRRTLVSLQSTMERAKQIFRHLATWQEQKARFVWKNGAILNFRYLERDADADNYQGHDYTRVYVEELTQFPDPRPLDKLKATLRSAAGVPTGFRATCNPGGPGHSWVKARYIDPGAWQIHTSSFDNPFTGQVVTRSRVFIPAKLSDNPQLLRNDPGYVANLYMSGSAQLVKAWLEGDWSVIEGAYFDEWSEAKHVIAPFSIPDDWLRFRSMDWGSASPFSVGWWAVVGDETPVWAEASEGLRNGVRPEHGGHALRLPRGALVRYREWYGASAPNVGLKLTAEQVGAGIAQRDGDDKITYGRLDPAAFAEDGGPSLAERINSKLKVAQFTRADNKRVPGRGSMGGWDAMRQRLKGDGERPMLYVFSTCRDFIRTVPTLQHDEGRPEDLDTSAEDHVADEARYACMSRPWVPPVDKPKVRKTQRDWFDEPEEDTMNWKVA
jgi:hypothetical protein